MRYVIYHGNCPDGFGAAFAAHMKFGEDGTKYLPAVYGEDTLGMITFTPEDEVYIVDFSFKRNILLALKDTVKTLVVLDHHKTAEEDLRGLDFCVFDMKRSGALITYDYFFPKGTERAFFEYISDRDLWTWKLSQSNEINSYLMSFEYTFENYSKLLNEFMGSGFDGMVTAGEAIIRVNDKNVNMICSQAERLSWMIPTGDWDNFPNTYEVALVNATSHWSDVGQRLIELNPGVDFSMSYFKTNSGKYKYSLRSKGDFDVSIIAKAFGGGGHKNAAGFESDTLIL